MPLPGGRYSVNIVEVKKTFGKMTRVIEENKKLLQELDTAIGDGDHGFNLNRGMQKANEDVQNMDFADLKALFSKVAMDFISTIGGASGPLYGTFFMRFAPVFSGKEEITREDFNEAFQKGVEGIKQRGGASVGDKTMVDVLEPVSQALQDGKSLQEVAALAKEKMEATKDYQAKKGRAYYLGERSIGHIDPGACSSCLLIQCLSGNED